MQRQPAQVGDGDTLQSWFDSLGLVTKIFLVSTLLSGAMLSLGMLSAAQMVLIFPLIQKQFQIWRLFTSFIFAGGFSFNFAIHTYVLYENCKRYEANPFNTGGGGSSADFLWMIIVCMAILLVVAYFFNMIILSEPILYVIMYMWSRREPDAQLNIFGFRFKSLYLPWVYIAIRLIMGGAITEPLIGVAVGHLYFFLIEVLPVTHGYNLIRTPTFCADVVAYFTGRTPIINQGYQSYQGGFRPADNTMQGGAFQGRGHTLGRAPAPAETPMGGGAGTAGAGAGAPGLRQRPQGRNEPPNPNTPGSYNWGRGRTLGET